MARFCNRRKGAAGLDTTPCFTTLLLRRHSRSFCRKKRIGSAIAERLSAKCCAHSLLRRGTACRAQHFCGTLPMNAEDRQECLSHRVIFLRVMPIRKINKKKKAAAKKERATKAARGAKGAATARRSSPRGTDPKRVAAILARLDEAYPA